MGSAVIYFAFFAPTDARERVTTTEEGGHGREDIWRVGWRMVEAHPVEASAPGTSRPRRSTTCCRARPAARSDFIVDTQKVAHNAYLQAWAEAGIIGLALFLAVILGLLAAA